MAYNLIKVGDIYKTNKNGDLEIIEYVNRNRVLVRFVKTGYETWTKTRVIKDGLVRDPIKPSVFGVGYIGCGNEKSGYKGVKTKVYTCWHSMMSRCYSSVVHERYPTYKNCTVCKDWHNFQVFAKWYADNYPKDGLSYELDKDILIHGNRVYSPSSCMFVTRRENSSFSKSKSYLFLTPKKSRRVIVSNLKHFCIKLSLDPSCMRRVSSGKQKTHKGWTAN